MSLTAAASGSIAYVECHSAENATTIKNWFDQKYVWHIYSFDEH